jgi:hypothetical protein
MKFRKRIPKGAVPSGSYIDKETGDYVVLYQIEQTFAVRTETKKETVPCAAK